MTWQERKLEEWKIKQNILFMYGGESFKDMFYFSCYCCTAIIVLEGEQTPEHGLLHPASLQHILSD